MTGPRLDFVLAELMAPGEILRIVRGAGSAADKKSTLRAHQMAPPASLAQILRVRAELRAASAHLRDR